MGYNEKLSILRQTSIEFWRPCTQTPPETFHYLPLKDCLTHQWLKQNLTLLPFLLNPLRVFFGLGAMVPVQDQMLFRTSCTRNVQVWLSTSSNYCSIVSALNVSHFSGEWLSRLSFQKLRSRIHLNSLTFVRFLSWMLRAKSFSAWFRNDFINILSLETNS